MMQASAWAVPHNPTQFVEPTPRFNVVRVRGVSPTCMWTVKAPLRRGFPLGLRNIAGCVPAVLRLTAQASQSDGASSPPPVITIGLRARQCWRVGAPFAAPRVARTTRYPSPLILRACWPRWGSCSAGMATSSWRPASLPVSADSAEPAGALFCGRLLRWAR
jgi:hypothetical protein